MVDSSIIIPSIIGFAGSLFFFVLRDIFLHNKRTKQDMRRKIIEKQLECLYSPLYRYLKSGEIFGQGKRMVVSRGSAEEGEGADKNFLDKLITKYSFLASEELHPLLFHLHGAGFYRMSDEQSKKIPELIETDYLALRKEYMEFKD